MKPWTLCLSICFITTFAVHGEEPTNSRRPANDTELRKWLENMVWHHRFDADEIRLATGLSSQEINQSLARFDIRPNTRPARPAQAPLLTLPYPGGRHPRIGFLDGAVDPQRETKVSVFAPWNDSSYVVVDVPEAIWSNLGLTYLAHTHVPTVWSQEGKELDQLEWQQNQAGELICVRTLPNGIEFGSIVAPGREGVRMQMWLTNGSQEKLSDLRVQNCVMLKGAPGFKQQTNDNKLFRNEFVAAHSPDKKRWIITAWTPIHRGWANPPCPCLHADPKFPDCAPGETQRIFGWLSFYEGEDIDQELRRLDSLPWRSWEPTKP